MATNRLPGPRGAPMRWRWRVAAILSVAGCGQLPGMSGGGGPAISIDSPGDGQSIASSSVWLHLGTTGVSLTAPAAAPQPGQAHYHVYVDGLAVGSDWRPGFLVT